MTCAWLSRSIAVVAVLFLLFPLPSQAAPAITVDITEPTECHDQTMVVKVGFRIRTGGSLLLDGCTLEMDSPPYQDRWLGATDEGLRIRVDPGASLQMRASATHPAILRPHDSRYGFRVDVDGTFVSQGQPGMRNEITGVEGFMSKQLLGAGLRVRGGGQAWINATDFHDVYGPATWALDGGHAWLRDVNVRKASGGFAARNGTLSIDGANINAGIEGIRIQGGELTLANASIGATDAALFVYHGQAEVRDSLLEATNSAVVLEGSTAQLASTRLGYGKFGVAAVDTSSGSALQRAYVGRSLLVAADCEVAAFQNQSDSVGFGLVDTDAKVSGCRFANSTRGAISLRNGTLEVRQSTFLNGTAADLYATDAHPLLLEGNAFTPGLAHPVKVVSSIRVDVLDGGAPVVGANVTLAGRSATTDAEGKVRLLWEPPLDAHYAPMGSAQLRVAWNGGETLQTVAADEREVTVRLGEGRSAALPSAFVGVVALVAVAGLRRLRAV